MRFAIGWRPEGIAGDTVALQHGAEREPSEAHAHVSEKSASRKCAANRVGRVVGIHGEVSFSKRSFSEG